MYENFLGNQGSGKYFIFNLFFIGFLAVICSGIDELVMAHRKIGELNMKIVIKFAVQNGSKPEAESVISDTYVDVLLASFENSGAKLTLKEGKYSLNSTWFSKGHINHIR